MKDYNNSSLRTRRPHRHRNSRKKLHSKNEICQEFICQNPNSDKLNNKSHRVNLIRPPPLFNLEPPPNHLGFLDIHNTEIYALDLNQKLICKTNNSKMLHNLTGSIVENPHFLNNRLNGSKLEHSLIRHHNFSRDGFIHETNIPQFISKTTTTPSSIIINKENSIVNFFLLFGISMVTVLFVFIIFYACFARRKKFSLRKKKRRSCQHQSDTSSEQVPSSTMSQSSYSSSDHPSNSLIHSLDQAQHLLAQEPAEFSHYIPNMTALSTLLNHQNSSQLTEQKVPIPASYLAYDWLSLQKDRAILNQLGGQQNRHQMTLNEKGKKLGNSKKLDVCGCSTLSTRATTETSSNTSASPSSTKSSHLTHQINQSLQQNDVINNHYQKLFINKNNSFRQNQIDQQNVPNLNYVNSIGNSNLTSPYLTNKVALLCNTNSNMPQLIKVMDIKELNDYVQLLNLDAKNRQMGGEHYENFYTNTQSTRSPLMIPTPNKNTDESDEVYELIDDLAPFSSIDAAMQNSSTQQHPSSSTLQKKKYPKTNPNYIHKDLI